MQRWAIGVVLFLLPAASYTGWTALQRWRVEAYARDAMSALTYCLMGPAPQDGTGAEAVRQLRTVAIGGDLARDGSWPGRCEPHVSSSDRALTALFARAAEKCEGTCCDGDARCGSIVRLRAELSRVRRYLAVGDKSGFDAGVFVQLSRSLGLLTSDAHGAPEPPRQASMLDHRAMRPLYEGDYLRLLTDPAGDSSLSLLFYEQDRRYRFCTLDLRSGERATCGALSDKIPVGMAGELFASERGAPSFMYAQGNVNGGWVEALYDVESGAEVSRVADRPRGGFVFKDGTVVHLDNGPPRTVRRLRNGDSEPGVPLELAAELTAEPRLIWDEIVWAERTEGGRHRVLARRTRARDEAIGPLNYLGVTPPLSSDPSIEVCRTEDVLALLVGANNGRGGVDAVLLFRDASGWRAPTEVEMNTAQFGFTCRGDTTTLSWIVGMEELPDLGFIGEVETEDALPVRGKYSVNRLRCGDGHCKHDEASVALTRFSRTSRYVAGDAGNSMVVLWRSLLGDVRMKVAPLQRLSEAPERSIFDDVEHDGFGWDLERDPIIGRSGRVLVLLSRRIGATVESSTYGFVVGDDGEVRAL